MEHWFRLMVEVERRRQEVARAAEHRHQNRISSRDRNRFRRRGVRGAFLRKRYELLLAALGDRLVLWGRRLQKRYERFSETTTLGGEQLELVSEQSVDSSGCAC